MLARTFFLFTGIALVSTLLLTGSFLGYPSGELLFFSAALTYFLVLGWLIMRRVPGNRIGLVFGTMALSIGVSGVVGGLGERGFLAASAIAGAVWMLWIGLLPLLFLWFPTGRVPSPRWRLVEVAALTAIGAVVLSALFSARLCLDGDGQVCSLWADNPIGVSWIPNPEYSGFFGVVVVVVFLLSLISLGFRYRIAGQLERLQLKWFVLAATIFVVSIFTEMAFEAIGGTDAPAWVSILNGLSILLIPVAATLAILRYRLYDIDRLISRTVSYALVIGLIGAGYFGLVSLFTTFLPSQDPLAVAASTLILAAAFNPLRRRVQTTVERRFNRSRFIAEGVIEEFGSSLQDDVDTEAVVSGWVGVVGDTMRPEAIGVWLREA